MYSFTNNNSAFASASSYAEAEFACSERFSDVLSLILDISLLVSIFVILSGIIAVRLPISIIILIGIILLLQMQLPHRIELCCNS